jgi:hypothetical protein
MEIQMKQVQRALEAKGRMDIYTDEFWKNAEVHSFYERWVLSDK